jgi:hypothetical protein
MSWPLAKTPLTPVRAGCDWCFGIVGNTSGSSWVASAVSDKSGTLICGRVELGRDVGSAFCCVVAGIGGTGGVDAGAGVTRGGAAAVGRALPHTGEFFSRGSTETLTGSLAGGIDADVGRSGTTAGGFGTGAEDMGSDQPCCTAMRRTLDISGVALTTVGTSGFQ